MQFMEKDMHGSTYGGNPLASNREAAVKFTINNKLQYNSFKMGGYFRYEISKLIHKHSFIKDIRGKGLMNAIECIDSSSASILVDTLRENHILTKTTHDNTLRMTPPLIIKEKEMEIALSKIEKALKYV